MKLKRVYHQYDQWEELRHNMYGEVEDKNLFLTLAVTLTSDHVEYGRYMRMVISSWPVSCENALTDYAINRKAWIGHAAVALAIQCPEDIVRKAWSLLTNEQRFLANTEATRSIAEWENRYRESKNLCERVGEPLLL